MTISQAWRLVKQALDAWSEDYAPSMGAALAYYTVFSIAPLLLIVIALAGYIFGAEAARGEILHELSRLMGPEGARTIEDLLVSASEPKTGALATIVGVVVLLLGATTVFVELQNDLDRIWRAPVAPKSSSVLDLLRSRLLSFGMIMGIAFLLMVSLVVSAGLSALGRMWGPLFAGWEVTAQVINFIISFVLITLMFALIYKIIPRVRIQWRDVWIGAAVTSFLFTLGKSLIGLYLGKSGVASGFGAAGSLVVLLIWVYYSAQIFLLGAEFTWVYAHAEGSKQGQTPPPVAAIPSRANDGVRPIP